MRFPLRCALAATTSAVLLATAIATPAVAEESPSGPDDGAQRYIVELAAPPIAVAEASVDLAPLTDSTGTPTEPERLAESYEHLHEQLAEGVGSTTEHSFTRVFNGFTAELTAEQVSALERDGQVRSISPDGFDVLHTAGQALGIDAAGGLWERLGGEGSAGAGVVVGVVDSGFAPENPMFAGSPLSSGSADPGVPHYSTPGVISMRKADGTMFTGACEAGVDFTATMCSTKVITARYFDTAGASGSDFRSPRDRVGHGSHTASTVAGIRATAMIDGETREIAGLAPASKLAIYKACWSFLFGSRCAESDQLAAIEAAVADGVDVLNYSLGRGSGQDDTVSSPVDRALLGAAAAGVAVVASASNNGPSPSTVDHTEPWLTTVAADTLTRDPDAPVVSETSGRGPAVSAGGNVLKPDISAPGTEIWAATRNNAGGASSGAPAYRRDSGTSMAAPHVAGLTALYLSERPHATPSEVKSAIMGTALPTRAEDGEENLDHFADGAGRISPNTALDAPFVYESGAEDWYGFLNGLGVDTGSRAAPIHGSDINQPSLAVAQLVGSRTVTRTVTSTSAGDYIADARLPGFDATVSPASLSFTAAGQTRSYTLTLTRTDAPLDTWQHGEIVWQGEARSSRLPISARAVAQSTEPPLAELPPEPEPEPVPEPEPTPEPPSKPDDDTKPDRTRPISFIDVPPGAKFSREISWMAAAGISTGVRTPGGLAYQPKRATTREAMAAFLYRVYVPKNDYTPPKRSSFADVPPTHQFYKEISWMRERGISTGVKQGSLLLYQPKKATTREAMAAFLYRAEGAKRFTAPKRSAFVDVETSHKFYREIAWMGSTGISTGVRTSSGRQYQPLRSTSREAMSAFLYRIAR
jgi:hypothetical protein